MPSDTPLTDFLLALADPRNTAQLDAFNASRDEAERQMIEAGLSADAQQAVLSRDVEALHAALLREGAAGDFMVPAGPVMRPEALRVHVLPSGVMAFKPRPKRKAAKRRPSARPKAARKAKAAGKPKARKTVAKQTTAKRKTARPKTATKAKASTKAKARAAKTRRGRKAGAAGRRKK